MVQPINYILQGRDPVEALFQGVNQGIGMRQAEQGMDLAAAQNARAEAQEARAAEMQPYRLRQAEQGLAAGELSMEAQRQNMAAAEEKRQRQAAFRDAMTGLSEMGSEATFEDYQRVTMQFPEFGQALGETWDRLDENRKRGVSTRLGQIGAAIKSGNIELAKKLTDEYSEAATNSGDAASAATAQSISKLLDVDPKAAYSTLGMTAAALGLDWAKDLFGTGSATRKVIDYGNGVIGRVTDQGLVVTDAAGNVYEGAEAQSVIDAAEQSRIAAEREINAARAGGRASVQLETGEEIKRREARGGVVGKGEGENEVLLAEMERSLPGLREVAGQLGELADQATYTYGGRLIDEIVRQSGFGESERSIARAKYIAVVDNQVLPLLRQTFGAAFTAAEGDRLRATLGDPDASPGAKKAKLEAFIEQKERDVRALREQQAAPQQPAAPAQPEAPTPVDEDRAFIMEMMQLRNSGQSMSPEQRARLKEIQARRGGN